MNIKFPYHSSEISDEDDEIEDDNNADDIYNCSRDLLLHKNGVHPTDEDDDILNESQSSIDELYQQITRCNDRNVVESGGSRGGTTSADNNYFNEHEEDSQSSVVVSYVEPMLKRSDKS